MNFYTINFRYRERMRTAHVHQFDSFYAVHFTDTEIIDAYGGRIEFDQEKKPVTESSSKDKASFYKAIQDQLR